MADRTYLAAGLPQSEPFGALVDPEPSVAVIGGAPLLQRRILAALDFDRLPVLARADSVEAIDDSVEPAVAVQSVETAGALVPELDRLRDALPETCRVVVFEHVRGGELRQALRAGASAVIDAGQVEAGLALAVRAAAAGLVVVPEAMRDRLEPPALSPREREVLALAADGSTTSEIAARLTVSVGTVKRHLSSCFSKLGVANRSEALALLIDADHEPAAAHLE